MQLEMDERVKERDGMREGQSIERGANRQTRAEL